MFRTRAFFIVPLVCVLAGCSFSRDGGYGRQFTLESAQTPPGAYRKTSHTLKIKLPTVAAELDTDRIALVQFDGRQDYIAGAKWADFLPVVIQSALVKSFAASGRYVSVVADDTPVQARYVLATQVEDFEIRMASGVAPALARIRLRVKLLPATGGRVLHEVVLEDTRPVHAFQLTGMMETLNRSFRDLQAQAVEKMGPR